MVANELLHNENIPRMVYEAYEVVRAEMGTLASEAEQNYISALLTVTELILALISTAIVGIKITSFLYSFSFLIRCSSTLVELLKQLPQFFIAAFLQIIGRGNA